MFVDSFKEENGIVTVQGRDTETDEILEFKCKKLIVAAGAIGTGRMVLNSFKDTDTRLPVMENPLSIIPLVDLRSLGHKYDKYGYEGGVVNLLYDGPLWEEKVLGALSSFISPLRGDALAYFPFSMKGGMALTKYMLPSLSMMLMFYPSKPYEENYMQLKENGDLKINYDKIEKMGKVENHVIMNFIRMGFFSAPFLVQYLKPGNSIHYAGTVPMCVENRKYHVDKMCRLNKAKNVFLADGSVFPVLPAKNLSYTLMANAMRVAKCVSEELES